MATKRGTKRKDKSRVVLKKGESQRKDGTYDYRWTSRNGRRHSIYAQTLEELRIKEDAITRDEMDPRRIPNIEYQGEMEILKSDDHTANRHMKLIDDSVNRSQFCFGLGLGLFAHEDHLDDEDQHHNGHEARQNPANGLPKLSDRHRCVDGEDEEQNDRRREKRRRE